MESREDFMSRCTKELTAKGKSEDEAHTCCEVAWDNRYNTTGSSVIATKKSDFMDTLNQDPRLSSNLLGMDDVILLGAMLYLWSSSGGSSYSYDAYNAPVVDEDSNVGSSSADYSKDSNDVSSAPVVDTDSDRGSSSSDYNSAPDYSSSPDYSATPDYSSSSSDYSSSPDYSSSSSDYSSSNDSSSSSSYD